MDTIKTVALVGFGEAGGILGAELARRDIAVTMWDIKLDGLEAAAMRRKAAEAGVNVAASLETCVRAGEIIVSAVTASSDAEVAEAVARFIQPGQVFVDINSVSPGTKQHGRDVIEATGAAFVESAVMAPVPPYGLRVPMLLGGRTAAQLAPVLQQLGFNATAISAEVGVASAVKMCRSVMIKGIEALSVECLSAARAYGAEALVLASLKETFEKLRQDPDPAAYLVSRVAEHGRRRAAEMREVSDTLREAGVAPLMSDAIARVQDATVDAMAARGIAYDGGVPFDWRKLVDGLNKP